MRYNLKYSKSMHYPSAACRAALPFLAGNPPRAAVECPLWSHLGFRHLGFRLGSVSLKDFIA
jgi:hypothetical protein